MNFGIILKNLRQDNNLTQEELAEKINTSRSNIANYENEKNKPSIEVLEKLSTLFDVSIDYLLGKSDVRKPENINADDIDIACFDGLRGLNETNKQVAKNIIDGLLAKQQKDDEENKH